MSPRLLLLLVLAVAALFVAGLFVPGVVGGTLLVLTDVILVALSVQARDRLHPRGELVRVVIVVGILVLAGLKFAGQA